MDSAISASPQILEAAWGRLRVVGLGRGRDFKLWPGGGRPWDWAETGTHHVPGIQQADVQELIERGSSIIVLSRGMENRLQVCSETLEYLEERGAIVHQAETCKAVTLYNRLARVEKVGGLFHSTC